MTGADLSVCLNDGEGKNNITRHYSDDSHRQGTQVINQQSAQIVTSDSFEFMDDKSDVPTLADQQQQVCVDNYKTYLSHIRR